ASGLGGHGLAMVGPMSAHGTAGPRQRVVIAGGGFAGFHAARRLGRLAQGSLEVVVVNPTDYFLYLPLLPEVAAAILDPRPVAVPMAAVSRRVRHVLAPSPISTPAVGNWACPTRKATGGRSATITS